MFAKIGRIVVHRPWWTVGAWVVVAAAIIALAPGLSRSSDQAQFLPDEYESVQASAREEQAFKGEAAGRSTAIFVVERTDLAPLTDTDQQSVQRVATQLSDLHVPGVVSVRAGPGMQLLMFRSPIAAMLPMVTVGLLLVVSLGLIAIGTNYNILMVDRLRDEIRAGHPPREAGRLAIWHAAPTAAAAAVILAGMFASLLPSGVGVLAELGMGRVFWWPGRQAAPAGAPATATLDPGPVTPQSVGEGR
jgi:uncharacterized membrane protein YdfJ with MMPL/SSD domain